MTPRIIEKSPENVNEASDEHESEDKSDVEESDEEQVDLENCSPTELDEAIAAVKVYQQARIEKLNHLPNSDSD